jgi:regulator of extracellular matrix RemA (YlzA/DUF370 family)
MSEAVARINENVYIVRDRVIAVVPVTSTVSRRIRASSQLGGKMVNLAYGKECKSIVFMNSGHSLLLAEPALEVRKKIWG